MRTIRLGRTNVQVPAVSLGTWAYGGTNQVGSRSVGWSGHDDDAALGALREAHAQGITHWDTADVYGDGRSEQLIGRVWGDVPRDEVFLATKVGWDRGGFDGPYHPDLIRQRIDRSLKNLQVERIDLYYFHHCDFGPDDERLADAVAVVREAQQAGKVRFVGLSDWDMGKIMRVIATVDPDVVQPYRNVISDPLESSGLGAWARDHDVGLAFFSPLRHGLLLGKYDQPQSFPEGDFRQNVPGFKDPARLTAFREKRDALRERFADRSEPVLTALLGALLATAPTGCCLVGQRTPAQVQAAAAAGANALTDDEAAWVLQLYADLRDAP